MSILVFSPTYNERVNVAKLIPAVRAALPQADLLIVDDDSPDGTWQVVEESASRDKQVHLLRRTIKDGYGRACVAGMEWGIVRGYDFIIQMDADFSHDPKYLPVLLSKAETADLALGSRYASGGGTRNWGLHRRVLSRFANLYVRSLLSLPVHDATGGFRCWRRQALEGIDVGSLRSNGYSFLTETLFRASLSGCRVVETPIVFVDRIEGQSKMSRKVIGEAVGMVWRLRLKKAQLNKHLETHAQSDSRFTAEAASAQTHPSGLR